MLQNIRSLIVLLLAGCLLSTNGLSQSPNQTVVKSTDKAAQKAGMSRTAMQSSKNIMQTLSGQAALSTFSATIQKSDAAATLASPGPFTVFAPSDAAFKALPSDTLTKWQQPASQEKLSAILKFHVVPGRLTVADLKDGQKLKTVNGEELSVTKADGKVTINGAQVTQADLTASNGVVHVVNEVLLPPNPEVVGNKK